MNKFDTLFNKIIKEQTELTPEQEAQFKKENGTLSDVMDALNSREYTVEYEDGDKWQAVNAEELGQTIIDILEANPEDTVTVTRN